MNPAAAIFGFVLYFVPTIVAIARKMPNKGSTEAVNFFLGWTLIGWVVALAMALGDPTPRGTTLVVNNHFPGRIQGYPSANQTASHSMPSRHPRPNTGVVWDEARQAFMHQDPGTQAWMIQSVDGTWLPVQTSDLVANVMYDIGDWNETGLARLVSALRQAQIGSRIEGRDLVVAEADESVTDAIVAAIENKPAQVPPRPGAPV